MPTYEYRCTECSKEYEVFHKGKEIEGDVVCPVCNSASHTRRMSIAGVSMKGRSSSPSHDDSPDACSGDGCCGGSCHCN